jgi:hypothetical protein
MIVVKCPNGCDWTREVAEFMVGLTIICPRCKGGILVELPTRAPTALAPSAAPQFPPALHLPSASTPAPLLAQAPPPISNSLCFPSEPTVLADAGAGAAVLHEVAMLQSRESASIELDVPEAPEPAPAAADIVAPNGPEDPPENPSTEPQEESIAKKPVMAAEPEAVSDIAMDPPGEPEPTTAAAAMEPAKVPIAEALLAPSEPVAGPADVEREWSSESAPVPVLDEPEWVKKPVPPVILAIEESSHHTKFEHGNVEPTSPCAAINHSGSAGETAHQAINNFVTEEPASDQVAAAVHAPAISAARTPAVERLPRATAAPVPEPLTGSELPSMELDAVPTAPFAVAPIAQSAAIEPAPSNKAPPPSEATPAGAASRSSRRKSQPWRIPWAIITNAVAFIVAALLLTVIGIITRGQPSGWVLGGVIVFTFGIANAINVAIRHSATSAPVSAPILEVAPEAEVKPFDPSTNAIARHEQREPCSMSYGLDVGRVVNGRFMLTREEMQRIQADPTKFNNVLELLSQPSMTVPGSQGTRWFLVLSPHSAALFSEGMAEVWSVAPDGVSFARHLLARDLVATIESIDGRTETFRDQQGYVGARMGITVWTCLIAWTSSSWTEYRLEQSSFPDGLGLLAHELETGHSPRGYLPWELPYADVPQGVALLEGNAPVLAKILRVLNLQKVRANLELHGLDPGSFLFVALRAETERRARNVVFAATGAVAAVLFAGWLILWSLYGVRGIGAVPWLIGALALAILAFAQWRYRCRLPQSSSTPVKSAPSGRIVAGPPQADASTPASEPRRLRFWWWYLSAVLLIESTFAIAALVQMRPGAIEITRVTRAEGVLVNTQGDVFSATDPDNVCVVLELPRVPDLGPNAKDRIFVKVGKELRKPHITQHRMTKGFGISTELTALVFVVPRDMRSSSLHLGDHSPLPFESAGQIRQRYAMPDLPFAWFIPAVLFPFGAIFCALVIAIGRWAWGKWISTG